MARSAKITIAEPFAGWSHITISDSDGATFEGRLSYLQNVYLMFIHAFHVYLKEAQQVAISCDEEGSGFTIVITPFCIDIIADQSDTPTLHRIYIEDIDFIKQCMSEFEKHFDKWVRFAYYSEEDDVKYEKDVASIRSLSAEINSQIDEQQKIWHNVIDVLADQKETPDE